jgi:copper chaperone CopZ
MTLVMRVPDMSCGHCKVTVEKALLAVDGVNSASVDLVGKSVSIEHADSVSEDALRGAVRDAGYSVAEMRA